MEAVHLHIPAKISQALDYVLSHDAMIPRAHNTGYKYVVDGLPQMQFVG